MSVTTVLLPPAKGSSIGGDSVGPPRGKCPRRVFTSPALFKTLPLALRRWRAMATTALARLGRLIGAAKP
jgi:hypothetical protein